MTAAHAADLSMGAPPPPVFTWTGFYAGVNGGAAFDYKSSNSYTYTDPLELPFNRTTVLNFSNQNSFGLIGPEIGYNWQFNSIVVGLEADYDWGLGNNNKQGFAARTNCEITACVAGPDGFDHFLESFRGTSFGTVRARLGYAFDRAMIYATGGFAWGEDGGTVIKDYRLQATAAPLPTYNGIRPDVTFSDNGGTEIGWTVGGGLAYAVTPNIILKGEYLYVRLSQNGMGIMNATKPDFGTISEGNRTDSFSVARVGIDFKFAGP